MTYAPDASPRGWTRFFLRGPWENGCMALIGIGSGLVASLLLTRLMAGLLYGVSAMDPLTFAVVAMLLMVVTSAACYIPASRAMRVDPITVLRHQ